ncbi:MAG: LysM peptidoglycan-binding domain-containing M23 family metallopeptidase [Proteobacteria bacterium]|nr:LysM peptidoglycan-binding domain-containing M23 family metallopeptidase [Pseudomonadota bacterium]
MMRRLLGAVTATLLLTACGNMVAPSMNSTYSSAPKNPNMGQVVNGSYVVAPGDTLAIISNRTNTPIRALIDNNGLQPPYNLRPGRELRISERQAYVVKTGDTLSGLARRFRVQQSALVELNNLKPPYALRVGQSLTLPSAVEATQSAAVALPSSTPATPPAPQVDVVPSAANAGSVSATALPPPPGAKSAPVATAAPSSTSSAKVQPLPPPVTVPAAPTPQAAPAATKPAATEPDLTAAEEAVEGAYEQQTKAKAAPTAPAPAPAPAVQPVQQAAVVSAPSSAGFVWPAQGKVISKFGTTSDGLRNDGINIAAPAGAPVMAAADGTVAYAGNQLRGFGNLVLIRHSNGLITAYAHNQSLLVQKGDKVKRGAVIARIGQTGNVAKPQLHFEIRKGEEPVDPMKYLGGGA